MTEFQTIIVVLAVCQFLFEYYLKVLNEGHVAHLMDKQPEDSKSLMDEDCLLYTSPSPRDKRQSRMPSSA